MTLAEELVSHPVRTRKRLRNGSAVLDNDTRGPCWLAASGADKIASRHSADHYEKLERSVLKGNVLDAETDKRIRNDISRTFPRFENVVGDEDALYRVLSSLSLYMPELPYHQSLSFVVGFSLIKLDFNARNAFWLTVALLRRLKLVHFLDTRSVILTSYLEIMDLKIRKELSSLRASSLFDQVSTMVFGSEWVSTAFTYSLDVCVTTKIWDEWIIFRPPNLFINVACALLRAVDPDVVGERLLSPSVRERRLESFKSIIRNENADPDVLMRKIKSATSSDSVDALTRLLNDAGNPNMVWITYEYDASALGNAVRRDSVSEILKEVRKYEFPQRVLLACTIKAVLLGRDDAFFALASLITDQESFRIRDVIQVAFRLGHERIYRFLVKNDFDNEHNCARCQRRSPTVKCERCAGFFCKTTCADTFVRMRNGREARLCQECRHHVGACECGSSYDACDHFPIDRYSPFRRCYCSTCVTDEFKARIEIDAKTIELAGSVHYTRFVAYMKKACESSESPLFETARKSDDVSVYADSSSGRTSPSKATAVRTSPSKKMPDDETIDAIYAIYSKHAPHKLSKVENVIAKCENLPQLLAQLTHVYGD